MKKNRTATALLAMLMAVGTTVIAQEKPAAAEKAEVKKQTNCPVMGGKINKKEYVDVKGYRIYVCCPGCKSKIKADPDTYIEKLKAEGVTLEKTPKKEKSGEKAENQKHDHSAHQP